MSLRSPAVSFPSPAHATLTSFASEWIKNNEYWKEKSENINIEEKFEQNQVFKRINILNVNLFAILHLVVIAFPLQYKYYKYLN